MAFACVAYSFSRPETEFSFRHPHGSWLGTRRSAELGGHELPTGLRQGGVEVSKRATVARDRRATALPGSFPRGCGVKAG